MQINPQEKIQLAALVGDTTDATHYYVQAVMRDTMSNTVLATKNLTRDSGNGRRFYGYMEAPSNNTPTGCYIDITVTFYTDSGYTTKAANLPESIESHIVFERWSQTIGGGGSGDPFYSNVSDMLDRRFKMLMPLFAEFGKVHKALKSLPDAFMPSDEADSEEKRNSLQRGILKAMRGAIKEHDNSTVVSEIKSLSEAIHTLVKAGEGSNEETRLAMKEAARKIMDASETIVASYLYHSVKELPIAKHPEPQGDMESALKDETANGGRMPSKGLIPVHIIHRNRLAMRDMTP